MAWGINTYNRVPIKRACNGYYLRWWYNGWHYWFFLPGKYTVNTQGENYKTIGTREIAMATGQITRSECDAIRTIMNTREVYLLTVAGWMNIRIEPGSINVYNNMVAGSEFEFVAIIGSKEITYTTGYSPVPGDGTIPEVPIVPPDIGYCEVIIGTQVWMCKNWDANYPNSKVYNNDEANRALYGGLYTWDQVMSPGFCPAGWHIPTHGEFLTLIAYLGGSAVAGGHLKEIGFTSWNAPNTGAVDTYGFTAKGAGEFYRDRWFIDIFNGTWFWTTDSETAVHGGIFTYVYSLSYQNAALTQLFINPAAYHFSVRMIKDASPTPITYDDWFLPSKDELKAFYDNILLFPEGVGYDLASPYWSSSEFSATESWELFAPTGGEFAVDKLTSSCAVIPVRTFISTRVYSLRDRSPSNGYIFHITNIGGGQYRYIECSSEIYHEGATTGWVWGNVTALLAGTNTAIGTGQANTNAIIGQVGHIISVAKKCNDFVVVYP